MLRGWCFGFLLWLLGLVWLFSVHEILDFGSLFALPGLQTDEFSHALFTIGAGSVTERVFAALGLLSPLLSILDSLSLSLLEKLVDSMHWVF